jgi:DNA polymerase III epsilon subunit-like protein
MNAIYKDTETGGLYPSIHALLSIGACCNWDAVPFHVYVTAESQPGKCVDPEAAKKNGYSPERWAECGAVDLATAMEKLMAWVTARKEERPDAVFVCHHLAFDKPFLAEAARSCGLGDLPHRNDWRCSQVLFGELMDRGLIERGSSSLNRLAELSCWSGIRNVEHNALVDAEITRHGHQWLIEQSSARENGLSELAGMRLQRIKELETILNTPEFHDFIKAVPLEAAHQVQRWGTEHDAGKEPQDWFWLIGYVAGKALRAVLDMNWEKALHHCVTIAACACNWHAHLLRKMPAPLPALKVFPKPCECGSEALHIGGNGIGDFFVECQNCGKRSSQRNCEGEQQAIERWNNDLLEGAEDEA